MERITHELTQGSREWLTYRAQHFNASDAAAMMGVSPYKTRAQLLHEIWTGLQPEFSDFEEARILAPGHTFERLAREHAEREIFGEPLYPVVMSYGRYSASLDGLTLEHELSYEHKRLSAVLREALPIRGLNEGATLPIYHAIQVEHQFMVSDSHATLFHASEWSDDGELIDERYTWVSPNHLLRGEILAGWVQFAADLETYVPPKAAEPPTVGKVRANLPALSIAVRGEVVTSNMDKWADDVRLIIRSLNLTLNSDQEFADADEDVKWCKRAEASLEAAKEHALSQTVDIKAIFDTMDALGEEVRKRRLALEPLIKSRKTERKSEIVSERVAELHTFVREQNTKLAPYALPAVAADFQAAIKGMSSFTNMAAKCDQVLASAKIETTKTAERMAANIATIKARPEFMMLFADAAALIMKEPDDCTAVVRLRITEHEAKLKRDAEAAAEAEREKIAAEERRKIEAEQAAKAQADREAQEARDREAAAEQKRKDDEVADRRRQDEESRQQREKAEADLQKLGQSVTPMAADAEPNAAERHAETIYSVGLDMGTTRYVSRHLPSEEIAQSEHAWINIGKMSEAFGFAVTADFIVNTLGFQWTRTEKAAKFWTPTQFEAIKRKLSAHVLQATPIPF